MVAVALAYGLVTVSVVLDSVFLAFGNAVILLLILFILHSNEWKQRREVLVTKAPQAGRHKKLPIIVDGA
jgi:hypothetical protein